MMFLIISKIRIDFFGEGRGEAPKSFIDKSLGQKITQNKYAHPLDSLPFSWYNIRMNKDDNMVQCDCCGLTVPLSHLSDDWGWTDVCGSCAQDIADDLSD